MKKLISWQTYLKSNPQKSYTTDYVGGRSCIEETLRYNGFTIENYHEFDRFSEKPKNVAIEVLSGVEYKEAVYVKQIARDRHSVWVMVGYKI